MPLRHSNTRGLLVGGVAAFLAALCGCAASGQVVVAPPGGPTPAAQGPVHVPKGHYPPPGSCRIWVPGVPPGQQSPPGNCAELQYRVPPGAVLIRG
ncbi:MAG TPA: hypothetical protein VNO84_11025 [Burkholderiaceae bacterium]|nr:hypothetical protein [Burkholderiaceae bacterium]